MKLKKKIDNYQKNLKFNKKIQVKMNCMEKLKTNHFLKWFQEI